MLRQYICGKCKKLTKMSKDKIFLCECGSPVILFSDYIIQQASRRLKKFSKQKITVVTDSSRPWEI